jgi:hypothetical protein
MSVRNEANPDEPEKSAGLLSNMVQELQTIHWGKVLWDVARGVLVGWLVVALKGDA